MTEPGTDSAEQSVLDQHLTAQSAPGGHRRKRRSVFGCLPVLIVLAVLAGLGYLAVTEGPDVFKDTFGLNEAADFPGPGRGQVSFEVQEGDSIAVIGRNLKDQGVVASVDAFTAAASSNPDATGIQVGFYALKREMTADGALAVLVDPDNLVSNTITFPEGLRVEDMLDIFVEKTDFDRAAFQKVLDDPEALGLPAYAEGDPEGYLFPSTYGFGPKETPETMLRAMVVRWEQAAVDADLEGAAEDLGYTPHELMTVASLAEAEASRTEDFPKVTRVIYNRLENPGTAGTVGFLQIDATINYALDRDLGFAIAPEDRAFESPYNTYFAEGLPPGPIEAPGDVAIQAATEPTDGDWYYYVTVNLRTGETKFAESYDEFLQFDAEFEDYCEGSDAC